MRATVPATGHAPDGTRRAPRGSLHHVRRRTAAVRRATVVLAAAAALASVSAVPAQADDDVRRPRPVPGSEVVTEWNAIATRTIVAENATPVPAAPLYYAFTHLAVYDAVVAVEGRYRPYTNARWARHGVFRGASSEVAAATAAYRVLAHYFPASAENLRADYRRFLAQRPHSGATVLGRIVGARAATDIIDRRRNDGRGAAVTLTTTPAPGVWRPTPPAQAAMAVPWLGFVEPLLLDSATQVELPGPDPITSPEYAADLAEVREYGSLGSTSRTPDQTATALFMNGNPVAQYQAAMRGAVTDRGLDIVDGARAYALLGSSQADALISAWRAKYDAPFWRPVTAIHLADTDGNDATSPDPSWTPLVATPPYPEYPSGHASVTGATTETLSRLFGADDIDVTVPSLTGAPARHYATAHALDEDATNGRIWLGFHFRTAMTDGNDLGHAVAEHAATHHFRPRGR